MKTIIGKKVGMTQIFDEHGKVIPVTVIEAGPCVISQVKSVETDGYNAIQLGFGDVKESKVNKPIKGHFAKAKIAPKKHLREFRVDSVEGVEVGTEVKIVGRIQSRNYEKKYEDGTVVKKVAYEVSVGSLEIVKENDNDDSEEETTQEAM